METLREKPSLVSFLAFSGDTGGLVAFSGDTGGLVAKLCGLVAFSGDTGGLVAKLCVILVTPWTVARQAPLSMGILQARVLEWVVMPSSRGSFQPRDQTQVSHMAGRFFTS